MKTKATATITDESFSFLGRIVTVKINIPTGINTSDEKLYFCGNTIKAAKEKAKQYSKQHNLQLKWA